ncbi:MAG: hypothetical protein ACTHOK_15195 [Nocardioidaceae bacterium]
MADAFWLARERNLMIAELVCQAIGLPDWAPRMLRRTAVVVLVATYALDRTAFDHGVRLWVAHEQHQIMQVFDPVLAEMASVPTS